MNTEKLIKNIHKFESDIEGINSSLDSIVNKRLTTITPQIFGAIGDGVADDLQALKDCLTYAITNNCKIESSQNFIYRVSDTWTINGRCYINLNDATIISDTENPIIDLVFDGDNMYGGIIENIKLDANFKSSTAFRQTSGFRRRINNIKCYNVKDIAFELLGGGVNKYSYLYAITDAEKSNRAIGIYNRTSDSVIDHADFIQMHTCVKHEGGNCFYTEVHGFIYLAHLMFDDSVFYHQTNSAAVHLDRCYPDTQQYCYYIQGQPAKLKITNNYHFINPVVLPESTMQSKKGCIFKFDREFDSKRVTVQNCHFEGLYYNGVYYFDVSNIKNLLRLDSTTTFEQFNDRIYCNWNKLDNVNPNYHFSKNEIRFAMETYALNVVFEYNPSTSGKLAPSAGISVGYLPESLFSMDSNFGNFSFPVEVGFYDNGNYKTIGFIRGTITDGLEIRVYSTEEWWLGAKYVCSTNNVNYSIKISEIFPLYKY